MKIETVLKNKKNKKPVEPEPQEQQERPWAPDTYSFYSRDNRTVGIVGSITELTANTVASQLLQLQADDPSERITVLVNTLGGDANAGFAIHDWLRSLSCPVVGITYCRCSSAGLPIFLGADYRLATRNTRFFYHEVIQWGMTSSRDEARTHAEQYEWFQDKQEEILWERTKIKKRDFNTLFKGKTSFFFGNKLAMELGIVHEEIDYVNRVVEIEGKKYGKSRKGRKS